MTELHPITLQLKPLFDATSLDAGAVELCRQAVDEYFKEHVFYQSDDFIDTLNTLYAINDKRTYSIIRIEKDKELFFLIPSQQGLRGSMQHAASRYLKTSGKYEKVELGEEHSKLVLLVKTIMLTITKTLTYMKRSATGIKSIVEVEYPPFEKLKLFYECERKMPYASLRAAKAGVLEENGVYLCPHCRQYHQGRSPNETREIDESVYLERYQRVWRWSHNLGEFRHKAENLSNSEL